MPHESTVEHEQPSKEYGPLENARRSTSMNSNDINTTPFTEYHELDEDVKSS